MRIGIVCPYSLDVPGGVQLHVLDLAGALIELGHEVSVLAPAAEDTAVPDFVEAAGRAIPVRYNGSVARLNFGPVSNTRTRRWLAHGDFDVLHIHEPITPSLGMLALWAAQGPVVATFHSSQERSRALLAAQPLVRSSLEKITGRIAVSEDARRTLVDHLGGDAVVIPNGVWVAKFADAVPDARWQGGPARPTIAFLGRLDEPRKGLSVLLGAVPQVLERFPDARFLIAGRGDVDEQVAQLGEAARAVELLGPLSEGDKAALFASVDAYVAPQTGGESFGIVLVEAMSAGAAVVSSDLGAFRRVVDEGRCGALFRSQDSADLARVLIDTLSDDAARAQRVAAASQWVKRFDWSQVTARILAVYDAATGGRPAPAGGFGDEGTPGPAGFQGGEPA